MTREEARQFGLNLLHGIVERNKVSAPCYANNVKQAIDALLAASLPSNLDEAAEKYSENILANNEDLQDAIEDAFKAGAEWMAGQGISMLGRVGIYGVDVESITKELREAGFNLGEEIILQIRKK